MTEVRNRTPRTLLLGVTAAAFSLLGGSTAGLAQVGPAATSTTTLVAAEPTTTVPPTTAAPTTVTPTTAPETKLIPVPQNTILDPAKPGPAPSPTKPGDTATSATTSPPAATSSTVPPASLSAGQADAFVRDQARTAASSTAALIEALRPLQNLGMTAQEALALGMGRFPVLGLANWNDDWLDYRAGPPVHAHQGTDVFSAYPGAVTGRRHRALRGRRPRGQGHLRDRP